MSEEKFGMSEDRWRSATDAWKPYLRGVRTREPGCGTRLTPSIKFWEKMMNDKKCGCRRCASVLLLLVILVLSSPSVAAQCEAISGTQIPLYWDANVESNIDYYRLQRSDVSGSGYSVVNTVLQGLDPISLTDFNPIPEAYYVVSAVNTDGLESGLSNELCVMVDSGPPPEPPPGSPPSPTAPSLEIITIPGD